MPAEGILMKLITLPKKNFETQKIFFEKFQKLFSDIQKILNKIQIFEKSKNCVRKNHDFLVPKNYFWTGSSPSHYQVWRFKHQHWDFDTLCTNFINFPRGSQFLSVLITRFLKQWQYFHPDGTMNTSYMSGTSPTLCWATGCIRTNIERLLVLF